MIYIYIDYFDIGFSILKDKIRVRDEDYKKREEDFLKSLETITNGDDDIDLLQPFM